MTPDEPNTNYAVLAQLAEQLKTAIAKKEGGDELQNLLAQLGLVLANMGQAIVDLKSRVDEAAGRERTRDLSLQSSRAENAMRFFASLSEEHREQLVLLVATTGPDISIEALSDRVADRIGKESSFKATSWQIRTLLQAVAYWQDFMSSDGNSEERAGLVASILADPDTTNAPLAALLTTVDARNQSSVFMRQLKRLICCQKSLGVTNKAEMLANRHERRYSYATVSTDIRPVFDNNIDSPPDHALLVHNLIVNVFEGGDPRTICIGLTSKNILDLSGVLNRAWSKDRTLRTHSSYSILPKV